MCDNIGTSRVGYGRIQSAADRLSAHHQDRGCCGGEAIIEGTRIAGWHIVGYYYKAGMSVEEILAEWEYLTPAQVFSALAYYQDNRDEIDQVRQRNSYEQWLENYADAPV